MSEDTTDPLYEKLIQTITVDMVVQAVGYILENSATRASDLVKLAKVRFNKDVPYEMWAAFLFMLEQEGIIDIDYLLSKTEMAYSPLYDKQPDDWE